MISTTATTSVHHPQNMFSSETAELFQGLVLGHLEDVQALVPSRFNPNTFLQFPLAKELPPAVEQITLFMLACYFKKEDVAHWLYENGADPTIQGKEKGREIDIFDLLIDVKDAEMILFVLSLNAPFSADQVLKAEAFLNTYVEDCSISDEGSSESES